MKKFVISLTEEQLTALHDSASKQDISAGELVRRVLIDAQIIPDAEIKHGGYRERRLKARKTKNSP